MANETRVFGKIVWLVIVLALIAYLYLFQYDGNIGKEYFKTTQVENVTVSPKTTEYVEITSASQKEVLSSGSKNIVSRRTTKNIDTNEPVIVYDNGSAYLVTNGAVIVDDKLVEVEEDESQVMYINRPMRIITSE